MNLVIAKTFIDVLARLPTAEQKPAKLTAFGLLSLSMMRQARDLEFKAVGVIECDHNALPPPEVMRATAYKAQRTEGRAVEAASPRRGTWARDHLVITHCKCWMEILKEHTS